MDESMKRYAVTMVLEFEAYDKASAKEKALEFVWGVEVFADETKPKARVVNTVEIKSELANTCH